MSLHFTPPAAVVRSIPVELTRVIAPNVVPSEQVEGLGLWAFVSRHTRERNRALDNSARERNSWFVRYTQALGCLRSLRTQHLTRSRIHFTADMAGDTMQAMPMAPIHATRELGGAAVQWACTRRGRMLVLTVVFFMIVLGLGGVHNREVSNLTPPGAGRDVGRQAANATGCIGYIVTIPSVAMAALHPPYPCDSTDALQSTLEYDAPTRKWRSCCCAAAA